MDDTYAEKPGNGTKSTNPFQPKSHGSDPVKEVVKEVRRKTHQMKNGPWTSPAHQRRNAKQLGALKALVISLVVTTVICLALLGLGFIVQKAKAILAQKRQGLKDQVVAEATRQIKELLKKGVFDKKDGSKV